MRADLPISFQQWVETFSYLGTRYGVALNQTLSTGGEEKIAAGFAGLVQGAAKSNGVVFACMMARQMLFQEARFQFRDITNGRPGDFHDHPSLRILDHPWPGATTGDLLARAEQSVSLSGNAIFARRGSRIVWLRSDWVTVVALSPNDSDAGVWDPDAFVDGYLYEPGGRGSGTRPIFIPAEQVAHWMPIPDPMARFRGMSWLSTVVTEIEADQAATIHKRQFFANGATPNLVVRFDPEFVPDTDTFDKYVDAIEEGHTGVLNAYRTLYLLGTTEAQVVGANLQQIDFKATQGAGETRIAAAANVPAAVVGISEGLQGSALNSGNYATAFRRFADLYARPSWRGFAACLENIVPPPGSNSGLRSSQLWYDDRDIPALRQDEAEKADILQKQAAAISTLVTAGFTPKSAEDAITTGELSRLEHSGLYSVQLREPGSEELKETPNVQEALAKAGEAIASGNGQAQANEGED